MAVEDISQNNPDTTEVSDISISSIEDDSYIKSIIADFTPAPSVHQFKLALFERIKNYNRGKKDCPIEDRGIKGVWKAISPSLKYKKVYSDDSPDNVKIINRIKEKTFYRVVGRLKKICPSDENMSFGIKGNILLMLNILDILKVKSIKDLLESDITEPDITSLVIDSNVYSEEILKRIISLKNAVVQSMRNKPRIPNLKVCRDWEQILFQVNKIIEMKKNILINTNNNPWDFYSLLGDYAKGFSLDTKVAIYICTLINEFKDYFPQDILLHNFIEIFSHLTYFDYVNKPRLIKISPIYLLYFFLLLQKRFINSFLSNTKDKNLYSPFIHEISVINNQQIISENVKNLLGDHSLTEFIGIQNKEILKTVMALLLLFKDNNINIKALQDKDIQLMYDILYHFINIHYLHSDYDKSHLLSFIKQIKSLNDLFNQLSLGKPFVYIITESHLNITIKLKQDLNTLYSRLSRLDEDF